MNEIDIYAGVDLAVKVGILVGCALILHDLHIDELKEIEEVYSKYKIDGDVKNIIKKVVGRINNKFAGD